MCAGEVVESSVQVSHTHAAEVLMSHSRAAFVVRWEGKAFYNQQLKGHCPQSTPDINLSPGARHTGKCVVECSPQLVYVFIISSHQTDT